MRECAEYVGEFAGLGWCEVGGDCGMWEVGDFDPLDA